MKRPDRRRAKRNFFIGPQMCGEKTTFFRPYFSIKKSTVMRLALWAEHDHDDPSKKFKKS